MKTMEVEVQIHAILTSALAWIERAALTPDSFSSRGSGPLYSSERRLGGSQGPVWTLWSTEISLAPADDRTLVLQPVAHRYPDSSIWVYVKRNDRNVVSFSWHASVRMCTAKLVKIQKPNVGRWTPWVYFEASHERERTANMIWRENYLALKRIS
jgi:hypothetical protein